MSVLVRCHRKKISRKLFEKLPSRYYQTALRLAVLLRLSTLLHRSRKDETANIDTITVTKKGLNIRFAQDELKKHPLHLASLEQEATYLRDIDFKLHFS